MTATPRPASLARRALPALVLTGASAGAVVLMDRPVPVETGVAGEALLSPVTAAATAPPTVVAAPDTTAAAPSDTTAPAVTATPDTAAAPDTTASTACTGESVTGPAVSTRWGIVQVAAVVSADGRLCDVEALQAPFDDRKSAAINTRALPVLHDRAVAAQGTGFQAVSGATVTSEGYRASLQAILDAA
jgi:uncharacterized protein with FMN-binding domain